MKVRRWKVQYGIRGNGGSNNHQEKKLYQWDAKNNKWIGMGENPFPPPPSRLLPRGISGSEPFYIYLFGVLAAIVALWITIAIVPSNAAAVLAPVIGVIGAFAGHAAGHSSAMSAVKEGKAEVPANLSQLQKNSDDRAETSGGG
jgi:hypothetical protein